MTQKYFKLKVIDTAPAAPTMNAPLFSLRPVPTPTDSSPEIIPVLVAPDCDNIENTYFLFGDGIPPSSFNKEQINR